MYGRRKAIGSCDDDSARRRRTRREVGGVIYDVDSGRSQIERSLRDASCGTDHQYMSAEQPFLSLYADAGNDDLARVPLYFVIAW